MRIWKGERNYEKRKNIKKDVSSYRVADVSAGVLTDDPRAAGRGILGHERCGVAAAAVYPVERLTIGGEADRLRGQKAYEMRLAAKKDLQQGNTV